MQVADRSQLCLAPLLVAVIALLPVGRLSEIPILILALWGLVILVKEASKISKLVWFKPFSLVFLAYFVMTAISALDSAWPAKSWLITAASLRFYLMGLVVLYIGAKHTSETVLKWVTWLALVVAVDAIIQALFGQNVFGQSSYPGRLTGIFGQNVKLGPVLALLLPLVMIHSYRYLTWLRWLVVALLLVVILLSGTRSAWLMAAFVLMLYWWHHVQGRRWVLFLKSSVLMLLGGVVLWIVSADFKQRVDRSMSLISGQESAIDFALADRLPIWQTALSIYQDHPINGVGARAFRMVYADYAGSGDVWVAQQGAGLHAHHWVLEVMAETGTIGLLMTLWLLFLVVQFAHKKFQNNQVWPFGVALMAAMLPVVSLYSLFSSFWSICLWWFIIMLFLGVKNAQD